MGEPEARRPLQPVAFGDAVRLAGGWVDSSDVAAGDVVRCSLDLELARPAPTLKASLRLVGADGERSAVDFPLVAPDGNQAGSRFTMRQGMLVPLALGPQPYEVRLVIYDAETLDPLAPQLDSGAVAPGGEAPVGVVYVTQSLVGKARAEATAGSGVTFGGGDEFDTFHFRGARWDQDDPGAGPLTLDLLWQLEGFTGTAHYSDLIVADNAGRIWAEASHPLFGGTFNFHDWRGGEMLAERRSLDLTALPIGRYHLLVGLTNADGKALPVDGHAGRVEIETFSMPFQRPWSVRALGLWHRLTRRLGLPG